ncbi:hypothetical protein Tco_0441475 [Tanacetum coccineum]
MKQRLLAKVSTRAFTSEYLPMLLNEIAIWLESTSSHKQKSPVPSSPLPIKSGDTKNFSYNAMESVKQGSDFIDIACEEYSQEILGFSEFSANGNSTPYFEPIVDTTSPTLTPFKGSDFILEEIEPGL